MRLGLLSRLVIVVVVVAILGGVAGALLLRHSVRIALRDQVEDRATSLALRLATSLDDRVDAEHRQLRQVAVAPGIRRVDATAVHDLNVALRVAPRYDRLVLFGPDGRAVASAATAELLAPTEVAPRPDLVTAVADGPVAAISADAESSFEYLVPVEDPPGTVVGVLIATQSIDSFTSRLDPRLFDPTAVAALTDGEGRLVAHPERARVAAGERITGLPVTGDRGGTETVTIGGDPHLIAAWPTSRFAGAVVVEQDANAAFAATDRTVAQLTAVLAVIVAAIVAAVVLVGRHTLRPIVAVSDAVGRFGAGERGARAPETGGGEARALAVEFNRMADTLEARLRDLAVSEQRLADILDNTPSVITVKDPEGRYLLVNRQFARTFGLRREDIVGRTLPDEDRRLEEEVLATGAPLETEEVRPGPNGDRTFLTVRFPLLDERHAPYAVCTVATDITERRRAERYEQELADAARARQQAVEINDDILQGLSVALYAFDLGDDAVGRRSLEETIESARALISRLLRHAGEPVRPSQLVRSTASGRRQEEGEPA